MSSQVEETKSNGMKKVMLTGALSALLLAAPGLVMAYPGAGGGGAQQDPGAAQQGPGGAQQDPGATQRDPGGAQQDPGMGGAAAPQEFDESTLQSFATASVALQDIQEEYANRLDGVQDQEKAIELQQEANEKMVSTVEEEGIDVQTYNAIANEMNVDEELNAQILGLIDEAENQ